MTDYHSELQALVDACESFAVPIRGQRIPWQTALDRARAALAEPKPPGPTDEELLRVLDCATASFPPNHPKAEPMTAKEYALTLELHKARAVLARWGNTTPQPVPEAGELEGTGFGTNQCHS